MYLLTNTVFHAEKHCFTYFHQFGSLYGQYLCRITKRNNANIKPGIINLRLSPRKPHHRPIKSISSDKKGLQIAMETHRLLSERIPSLHPMYIASLLPWQLIDLPVRLWFPGEILIRTSADQLCGSSRLIFFLGSKFVKPI